ncbi:MAG: thioredoxin family protein [Firmicutes bacterium]|nr:thioredoxin family protein [Bacillota bacterium]
MLELNKDNFEAEVKQASGKILVDYFGTGCVPCEALMPIIVKLSENYGDKLKFTKLNTTQARRLAIGERILGLPVVAIYENGQKLEELVKDDCTESKIEEMIKRHI